MDKRESPIKTIANRLSSLTSCELTEVSRDLLYLIVLLRQGYYKLQVVNIENLVKSEVEQLIIQLRQINFVESDLNKIVYLICAAIDEAYTDFNNVNGRLGLTGYKSLISYFYKEEFAGENFFKITDTLYSDVTKNLSIMKLSYLLLSLGFQGQYALKENGVSALETIVEKLRFTIITAETELQTLQKPIKKSLINRLQQNKFFKLKILFVSSVIFIVVYYLSCAIELHYKKKQLYQLIHNYDLSS